MIKKIILYTLLFLFTVSCTKDVGKKIETTIGCSTPPVVSFSNDLKPIFNQHCNTSGCHSGNNPAGNLNLESSVAYSQLMNPSSGYVDTITPKYSVLYAQMNSSSNPMPPTGKLDNCTLELVLKWIQQKAKNN